MLLRLLLLASALTSLSLLTNAFVSVRAMTAVADASASDSLGPMAACAPTAPVPDDDDDDDDDDDQNDDRRDLRSSPGQSV